MILPQKFTNECGFLYILMVFSSGPDTGTQYYTTYKSYKNGKPTQSFSISVFVFSEIEGQSLFTFSHLKIFLLRLVGNIF